MSDLTCPKCELELRTNRGGVFCSNEGNCDFKIWRKIAGKELTDEELAALARGEQVLAMGLISKKGKSFNAWLVPGDEGVEFSFENLPGDDKNTRQQ